MQYFLNINVAKATEWELDSQLACLFSYILTVKLWAEPKVMDGNNWYWIAKSKIIHEVPFLGDKPDTIYRQMKRLQNKGLIVINKSRGLKRTYIQITEKALEWHHDVNSASEHFPNHIGSKSVVTSDLNPKYIGSKSEGSVNHLSTNQDHKNIVPSSDDTVVVQHEKQKNTKTPDCPHLAIIDAWNEIAKDHPMKKVTKSLWKGVRAKNLATRWKEGFTTERPEWMKNAGAPLYTDEQSAMEFWKGFFRFMTGSDFLMGRTEAAPGHKQFRLELPWVVKLDNFIKIIERNYHGDVKSAPAASQVEFRNGIK